MNRIQLAVVLTSVCFGTVFYSVYAEPLPENGGTLIIGRSADSFSLDPAKTSDSESGKVISQIFDCLVRYKGDTTEIEPDLAESWETSADGKEWIFHLRKNVLFHDKTPVNADAVVFTFMRQIDPNHPYYLADAKYAKFIFKYLKRVEALSEYDVKFTLEKPYAPFLFNLRIPHGASIVSPDAVKKWNHDFSQHPVGSGPFKFVSWIPNDQITLESFSDFWEGAPLLEKVIFKTISNASARFDEFRTGRINLLDGLSPTDAGKIEQIPDSILIKNPGLNVAFLAMNTEKPPFNRVKIRQAVNYAINKQNLIKLFYQDLAITAKTPLPPNQWGYNPDIVDYEYNPEKAKLLLREEGFEKGFETNLWVMDAARPYMPEPEKIAGAIKKNLASVGIHAVVTAFEWKTYIKKTDNGEHDMCLLGWIGDNGDPDNYLYTLLDSDNAVRGSATNRAFYKNPELHKLLIKAQEISDMNERIRLYHQAQEIILQDAPWVPLAHMQRLAAVRRTVQGLFIHPTGIVRMDRAWIMK